MFSCACGSSVSFFALSLILFSFSSFACSTGRICVPCPPFALIHLRYACGPPCRFFFLHFIHRCCVAVCFSRNRFLITCCSCLCVRPSGAALACPPIFQFLFRAFAFRVIFCSLCLVSLDHSVLVRSVIYNQFVSPSCVFVIVFTLFRFRFIFVCCCVAESGIFCVRYPQQLDRRCVRFCSFCLFSLSFFVPVVVVGVRVGLLPLCAHVRGRTSLCASPITCHLSRLPNCVLVFRFASSPFARRLLVFLITDRCGRFRDFWPPLALCALFLLCLRLFRPANIRKAKSVAH